MPSLKRAKMLQPINAIAIVQCTKHLLAQLLCLCGQVATLLVSEADPLALELLPQHPIFFRQVLDHLQSLAVVPMDAIILDRSTRAVEVQLP